MSKKINCWDEMKCKQTKCPAYGIKGASCWLIPNTLCYDSVQSEYITKIGLCSNCKVFDKNLTISSAKETLKVLNSQLNRYYENIIKHKNDFIKINEINEMPSNSLSEAELASETLNNIIDFLPDATFVINKDKKVISWNRAIEHLTGVKKEEILGKGDYAYSIPFYGYKRPILIDLLDESNTDIESCYAFIERKINLIHGEVYIPLLGKEKREAHLWVIASPIFDSKGNKVGAIESIRDITQYKQTEKMLLDINEKLRLWANELEQRTRELAILNEMSELIQSCFNIEETLDIITTTIQKLFPYFSGSLYMLSKSTNIFESVSKWGETSEYKDSLKPNECLALKQGMIFISELNEDRIKCKHISKKFSGNFICIPLTSQKETIGLLHLQSEKEQNFFADMEMAESRTNFLTTVTEHISLSLYNIRLRESLKYQAIRDPLTGLFNRRYMEETLVREIRRALRNNSTLGLIIFDIDHFKRFNDTFGHAAGDTMLREIASFIKSNIRAEDIASRYGGEEFLITMPDANLLTTFERAEKLRQGVKKLEVKHQNLSLGAVTLSFGVAEFPKHAKEGEALIKAADNALYRAKAEGRDRVVVAEP